MNIVLCYASQEFRTVKLIDDPTKFGYFINVCEILYICLIFYYLMEEVMEICHYRFDYFKKFWNIIDISIILLSLLAMGSKIWIHNQGLRIKNDIALRQQTLANFENISFWAVQYVHLQAIIVAMCWAKLFKYVSFNNTMSQVQKTIARCVQDMVSFAIIFVIVFMAYAFLGGLYKNVSLRNWSKCRLVNFKGL